MLKEGYGGVKNAPERYGGEQNEILWLKGGMVVYGKVWWGTVARRHGCI